MMDELIKNAFETGSGLSIVSLTVLAEVLLVGSVTLWAVWTAVGTYQLWHDNQATSLQLFAYTVRAGVVVFILFLLFS